MTDSRSARKTAERAAQALLEGTLVSKAGDLGAAAAARTDAADGVTTARDRGTELAAEAQRQADELVTAAQHAVTAADTCYATAWTAATTAGWTEASLRELGYQPPDHTPRRRRTPRDKGNVGAAGPTPPIRAHRAVDTADDHQPAD